MSFSTNSTDAFAKMKTELSNSQQLCKSLELEKNALVDKLKQKELKVTKLEKEQQQTKKQSKKDADLISALQTKIVELEAQRKKEIMDKLKQPQNCWAISKCHSELNICGHENLIVQNNGNESGWRSVFAKYSILDTSDDSSNIFYFEISVKNVENAVIFGFAVKHQTPLDVTIRGRNVTYAYESFGTLWIDRSRKSGNEEFGIDDTVGCGVNLGNKKLFFTKNGRQIGPTGLSISAHISADDLFPLVSLLNFGDKIEANFGPNFIFDLATLC